MAKTILIIDDERDMQIYLKTLFRKAGYEARVAANGEEGLELARELRPDLITLDLLMPRKSGVLAYEGLRTAPETREIPVIILTGLSSRESLFNGGIGDLPKPEAVVDKPIDRDAFLKQVKEIIGPGE
jgi:CheY-like chemotaxis protein